MKKELFGIFLIFLIILTSVSLFSYHAADPCVGNHFFSFPDHVNNLFGLIGAHVAGLFCFFVRHWCPVGAFVFFVFQGFG